jgi:hydrogenase maturation protein HypF
MTLKVCQRIRAREGLAEVALSGGVWQNVRLLERVAGLLNRDGFTVHLHRNVPVNDGGVALGQAVIAAHLYTSRR